MQNESNEITLMEILDLCDLLMAKFGISLLITLCFEIKERYVVFMMASNHRY